MKASDLRGGVSLVNQGMYGVNICSHYEIYQYALHLEGLSVADYYKHWKPIPLTEEWFLKFGYFEQYKNVYTKFEYESNEGRLFIRVHVCEGLYYIQYCDAHTEHLIEKKEVKFVHDFQNDHKQFTGEELTIKPS